jgi:hypothetical protein
MSTAPESEPRILLYFPIVHNPADMGALSESVKRASVKKFGRAGWKRKVDLIEKFWTDVEDAIDHITLSPERVRIYQDGLPISGKETDIVRELAKSGSRNHALLQRLIDSGAQVMGTESLELLLEEYELAKRMLESEGTPEKQPRAGSGSASLLQRRDLFIARRINATLLPGEVGIVFLGMLHDLDPWLDKDIRVIHPVEQPVKR